MAEYATKDDVQHIVDNAVNKAVDELSGIINNFASVVDERFNKVETRLEKLESSHNRLISTLDAFLKRLDDIEKDNEARDAQYARLERWVQQIADQTGIKLT